MNTSDEQIVVSLTTYPKRIDYFKRSFTNLLTLDEMDKVWKIVVVFDDNLTDEQYKEYDDFLKPLSEKIEIIRSDHRWKCANKMVPTYNKYGQEHTIVLFDDDKDYPKTCLTEMLEEHKKYPHVIVAQEINPVYIDANNHLGFINDMDIKMRQLEWGKYLSNACLFPPKCFGDGTMLNDIDSFYEITGGNNDEQWFWIVSTVNGVQCMGLDNTLAYLLDDGVTYKLDDTALSNINIRQCIVNGYNTKTDEKYGDAIKASMMSKPVTFDISKRNFYSIFYGLGRIHALFDRQPIEFIVDKSLPKSFPIMLGRLLQRVQWHSNVSLKIGEVP